VPPTMSIRIIMTMAPPTPPTCSMTVTSPSLLTNHLLMVLNNVFISIEPIT